jgi:hypothetical protein
MTPLTDVTVTQADINKAEDDAIEEASRYSPEAVAKMLEGWEDASWKFDNRRIDVMDGDSAVATNVWYEAGPLLASAPGLARAYLAEVEAHAETRKEVARLRHGLMIIAQGDVPDPRPPFNWHDKYIAAKEYARAAIQETKP